MATPTILIVPDRYKSGVLYSQLPESGAVDFGVTRATTAYRTNASGILESVASGVPRLDYPAAGGCPSLLVEPAATNLLLRSEEFDNAVWTKTNATITANAAISPNATTTADKLIMDIGVDPNGANANGVFLVSSIASGTYTWSIYAKRAEFNTIRFRESASTGQFLTVNLDTGVITNQNIAQFINPIAKLISDGWYRISFTTPSNTSTIQKYIIRTNQTGDGTSGIFIWGAQLETGSVATSYIPTTTATATRNADLISKSGVSGFIGQTEGCLYAEVDLRDGVRDTVAGNGILEIATGSTTRTNTVTILKATSANNLLMSVRTAAANTILSSATPYVVGINKIALAYQSGNTVLYVNGVLALSSATAFTFSGALDAVNLGFYSTAYLNDRIRAAAIYATRLEDDDLIALTTL
jgi:hypothetical protein